MAKKESSDKSLVEFNYPVEGVTIMAQDKAEADKKLKEFLKSNE